MNRSDEVLEKATELVKEGWCKYRYAIDEAGGSTNRFGEFATCFCMAGAIERAAYDLGLKGRELDDATVPLYLEFRELYGSAIDVWNDSAENVEEVVERMQDWRERRKH